MWEEGKIYKAVRVLYFVGIAWVVFTVRKASVLGGELLGIDSSATLQGNKVQSFDIWIWHRTVKRMHRACWNKNLLKVVDSSWPNLWIYPDRKARFHVKLCFLDFLFYFPDETLLLRFCTLDCGFHKENSRWFNMTFKSMIIRGK